MAGDYESTLQGNLQPNGFFLISSMGCCWSESKKFTFDRTAQNDFLAKNKIEKIMTLRDSPKGKLLARSRFVRVKPPVLYRVPIPEPPHVPLTFY